MKWYIYAVIGVAAIIIIAVVYNVTKKPASTTPPATTYNPKPVDNTAIAWVTAISAILIGGGSAAYQAGIFGKP